MTGSTQIDAERAFARAARARRRAALLCRLRRRGGVCGSLEVLESSSARRVAAGAPRGIREIPVRAIRGTVEPSRARQFDCGFRPSPLARLRWQRVWLAEHQGIALPPITVVPVGTGYAVRDGHHRVSVAAMRGALTIDAIVDGV